MPDVPGPIPSVLHTTDGQSVVSSPSPTGTLDVGQLWGGGGFSHRSVQLAPDASSLVVSGDYLAAPDSSWEALPSAGHWLDGDAGGAVWPTGAVALWEGASLWWNLPPTADTGGVEAFAVRTGPTTVAVAAGDYLYVFDLAD
jgi:hypothetical protein